MRDGSLACIRCRAELERNISCLVCRECGARYPRMGGVPVLLPESLTEQQLEQSGYFDSEFAQYDRYQLENWRRSYISRIFSALDIRDGRGPYLDVGVGGSGATVIEAARLGIDAVGCDLSIEGVRHAELFAGTEGIEEHASFVACAAESLPFRDASFGCASAVAVLEHLDDDVRAVRELARVVRPGGLVWVTVPLAYRYILPPLWPLYVWHDRRIGHKRHYHEAALVRIFEQAAFSHVATTYTGHVVKLLQLVLDRLLPLSKKRRDRLWWSLERLDLRAVRRAYGALQLNAVFRRRADAEGVGA